MNKKRFEILGLSLLSGVLLVGAVISVNAASSRPSPAAAGDANYTYTLDGSTPFSPTGSSISTQLTKKTANGNDLSFTGMNVAKKEGCLASLPYDPSLNFNSEYIGNTTPINGLLTFTITLADAEDTVYLEWTNNVTGMVQSQNVSSGQTVTFSGSMASEPDSFKFGPSFDHGRDGVDVLSLTVTYTCKCSGESQWPTYLEAEVIDGKAYLTDYHYLSAGTRSVIIPAYYNGYPVVGFKDDALIFRNLFDIGYLYFPNTFESIPSNVCSGCSRLTGVRLPSGLQTIPSYAFSNCYQLQEVAFPDELVSIESYAFTSTKLPAQVRLPSTCTSVGMSAFQSSTVESFVVSSDCAFADGNDQIVLGTHLPARRSSLLNGFYGVTDPTIKTYEYSNGDSFTYVTYDVGDGESQALVRFTSGSKSTGYVTLPELVDGLPVTMIGPKAFASNSKIKTFACSSFLRYVGYQAFYGCSNLTLFNGLDSLEMIGAQCFYVRYPSDHSSPLSLELVSEPLTFIGSEAFNSLTATINFSGLNATLGFSSTAWKSGATAVNIYTNVDVPTIPSGLLVNYQVTGDATVDVYVDETRSYVSKNRHYDYARNLSTGEKGAFYGDALFKVNAGDSEIAVSDITITGTYSEILALGDNVFQVTSISSDVVIAITAPIAGQLYTVTLNPTGSMSPYFYDDPSTMSVRHAGLSKVATDANGDEVYDGTGLVVFEMNLGANRRPVFDASCIHGTYTSFSRTGTRVTITGVQSDLTVDIKDANDYYDVNFVYDEGVDHIVVYATQNYTSGGEITDTTVTRNPNTGAPASTYSYAKPQVNFEVVLKDGYSLSTVSVSPSGSYNNIKAAGTNIRRVTVITADITITVKSVAASA